MPRYLLAFLCIFGFSLALHGQSGDWKQLFDGKDLTGWKHVGPGYMTVEDGLIRTHGGMGLLYWTGGNLGGCTNHLGYKIRGHNEKSGPFFPIPAEPPGEWMPGHYCSLVPIDNHPANS